MLCTIIKLLNKSFLAGRYNVRLFIIPASVFTLLLILCIVRSYFSKRKVAASMRRLLFSILIPLAANFIIVLPNGKFWNTIGYMLYFAGTDVMLYCLFTFSMEYCDFYDGKKPVLLVLNVFIILDVISIALNPFLHHFYDITPITLEGGYVYYSLVSLIPHKCHLVL